MLIEYYFKIKHIKSIDNTKVDTLSRKAELQGSIKLLNIILRIDDDGKIRYNYLKLVVVHEVLIVNWMQRI